MFTSTLTKQSESRKSKSNRFHDVRAFHIVEKIKNFIPKQATVIDVGAERCEISESLQQLGAKVTAIDIVDKSKVSSIKPIIYDGKKIPFNDDSFDVSLLITVLHHIKDPEEILRECARVSRRIIVIEDTYENSFEKYFTYIVDSIMNLEFFGHPHSNKNDREWKDLFDKMGLVLVHENHHKFYKFMNSSTYILDVI